MADDLVLDSEIFISSRRASETSGYARDHIGYLARKGLINARRIGGLWYVSEQSLKEYRQQAESFKPEPPSAASRIPDPDAFISFDGKEYVSVTKGAALTGYHQDYVGQLARDGKILSRQIGIRWYVSRDALIGHKKEKDALLAAVQAEAVGLRRSTHILSIKGIGADEDGPFMTYTRDNADLVPVIPRKERLNYESRIDDMPISSHISFIHPIQIKRINTRPQHATHRIRPQWAIGVSITLATVVIIVMVGYVSIQNRALYTSIKVPDANVALVAEVTSVISRAGDFIESALVPELTYRRGK